MRLDDASGRTHIALTHPVCARRRPVANMTSTLGRSCSRFENELGGLELLALHDEGVAVSSLRMAWSNSATLSGRPVPELKNRRDEPDARHIVGKAVLAEQIEGGRVRGRRARIRLRRALSSNTRTGRPRRPSSHAQSSPTGPPPAINTRSSGLIGITTIDQIGTAPEMRA